VGGLAAAQLRVVRTAPTLTSLAVGPGTMLLMRMGDVTVEHTVAVERLVGDLPWPVLHEKASLMFLIAPAERWRLSPPPR
jgi:hypothetical protein